MEKSGVPAYMRVLFGISMMVAVLMIGWGQSAAPVAAEGPCPPSGGIVFVIPFCDDYSALDLGAVPGVPIRYGGLTFKLDDPNVILIGGDANAAPGALYAVEVVRDVDNHIIGFAGDATFFADAAYNDGGVTYGPGDVLFLARWPINELGQTLPGSTITDKIIDLDTVGIIPSPGGLFFVPPGFPGAGQFKIATYDTAQWYTVDLAPDGLGTYDITGVTLETSTSGGPEGFIYVPSGSPQFTDFNEMIVTEFSANEISAFELDANGNPVPATRRTFITQLSGPEGAVIDPLTGDFLFSTFGAVNKMIVVQGFTPPAPTPTSTPTATATSTPVPSPTPTMEPLAIQVGSVQAAPGSAAWPAGWLAVVALLLLLAGGLALRRR